MSAGKPKLVLNFFLSFSLYIVAVLCIMRHWRSAPPWDRLDRYVVIILAFSVAMAVLQMVVSIRISDSAEIKGEFFGLSFDRAMSKWISIISILELLAFADYSHWRLVPALANHTLQTIGVFLYAIAGAWMWRVDSFLMLKFESAFRGHYLLVDGPFKRLCHPRYTALLLSRVAFSFTIGSIVAWLLLPLWVLAILSRIHKEEGHLRAEFGNLYNEFAAHRDRLIPGLF